MSEWGIDHSDYDSYDPGDAWGRNSQYQPEYFNQPRQRTSQTGRGLNYQQGNYRNAFTQEDKERNLLEKHLVAWQELIANQEFYLRKDLQRNVSSATSSAADLGSQFNEPQLNRKIQDLQSGEERSLFTLDTSEGNAKFSCSVCQINVVGIKTLQSHILGKKHKNKVSGYKIIGE